eukprot:7390663-Prymnesium_polylepis.1
MRSGLRRREARCVGQRCGTGRASKRARGRLSMGGSFCGCQNVGPHSEDGASNARGQQRGHRNALLAFGRRLQRVHERADLGERIDAAGYQKEDGGEEGHRVAIGQERQARGAHANSGKHEHAKEQSPAGSSNLGHDVWPANRRGRGVIEPDRLG